MIEIRSCQGQDELEACVQLEIETWGMDTSEIIPRKAFLLAQKIGGQVIGAFDTGTAGAVATGGPESLIGFAMSWPGMKTGGAGDRYSLPGANTAKIEPRSYLHSHMLAVREDYRNRGLGTQLKLAQRQEALDRGIQLMEWTFDPLEIKNAYLNLCKLGAISRRYEVDFYGVSSSRLQGGLPTDRLVAEWQLDSPRIEAILEGRQAVPKVIVERIPVPASIYEWKASEDGRERALAVQLENRHKFQQAFSRGLTVLGYTLDEAGNGFFELGPLTQVEAGY